MFAAGKTKGVVNAEANYIESCFSTYLYTGNGSTQTITNGIDLSGKGGLTWIKERGAANYHRLFDTSRGPLYTLYSDLTNASTSIANSLTSFNSNGFSLGSGAGQNADTSTYVSWTFRKQPKFFDVVTWTGDGAGTRYINHNLASVPGCIIVKATSTTSNWFTWHIASGITSSKTGFELNSTVGNQLVLNSTTYVTSTSFNLGAIFDSSYNSPNNNGTTYVAYLFASNAGGFGLTGTDNVISCGSVTGSQTVNLGYEPQLVISKCAGSAGQDWTIVDNMRGAPTPASGNTPYSSNLMPNLSNAENSSGTNGASVIFNSTGFRLNPDTTVAVQYIYIAIRRGPMKVPTVGTSVFSPQTATYSANQVVTTGFPVDLTMIKGRTITLGTIAYDRLRGLASTNTSPVDPQLITSDTSAETSGDYVNTANNTGYQISPGFSGFSSVNWNFQRAPSFFDEVCAQGNYNGLSTPGTPHNLGVKPELVIQKSRNNATTWNVVDWNPSSQRRLVLNTTAASDDISADLPQATSSVFYSYFNSTHNCVNYLFASCPGVSKVGLYTGNGTTQTINCGFTGGARFVLIKRTDSTGDWYVYDTARGMTTLTDPYLLLNSTSAESATLGSVTTVSTGFAVNASILAAINTNGASYIYLSIA